MPYRAESKSEGAAKCSGITPWERRDFWQRFKWHMEACSGVRCSRVTSDGWMWHNTDLTIGNMLSLIRVRLGEIGVKYTLNDANAETVNAFLHGHRQSVDAFFTDAPVWRVGGDGSRVIEVRRPVEAFDRSLWPRHFLWLQRQLETFHVALSPLIGRMPPKGEITHWDEELLFRELQVWNPTSVGPAKALLDWTHHHGATATWGRGRRCGSFAITSSHQGTPYQLVRVNADGTMSLLFTQLRRSPLFQEPSCRLELLRRLNEVRPFALPEQVIESRLSVPLAMLADGSACDEFLDVLCWFGTRVRAGRVH